MLWKVIHPVYRVEAKTKEEALKVAEKAIKSGQIRVCPAEEHRSLAAMFLFGPK